MGHKRHGGAELNAIATSVREMIAIAEEREIVRIGLPHIDARLGRLPRPDIRTILERLASVLLSVCDIYESRQTDEMSHPAHQSCTTYAQVFPGKLPLSTHFAGKLRQTKNGDPETESPKNEREPAFAGSLYVLPGGRMFSSILT
ncbi:MAG: hypothetical protein ABI876_08045 [Bacteroidota bacterium]